MLFVLILLILIFLSENELFWKKNVNKWVYWGIIAALILCAGLRHGAGPDDATYYDGGYALITTFSKLGEINFEPGFSFLMYLFRLVNAPFWLFLLVFSAASIGLKAVFFDRAFPKFRYCILTAYYLMFYFNVEMAQIRLGFAMGLCLFATLFLLPEKKNPVLFHVLVLLACTIQITALAYLPAYILTQCKYRKYLIIALTVLLLPFAFLDLTSILLFINDHFLKSYYLYVKLVEYLDSLSLLNMSLLLRVAVFLFCLYFMREKRKEKSELQTYLILYFYGIFLYFGLRQISVLAIRMASLFRIFEVPLLLEAGRSVCVEKNKMIRVAAMGFMGILLVYYVVTFFSDMLGGGLLFFYPAIG